MKATIAGRFGVLFLLAFCTTSAGRGQTPEPVTAVAAAPAAPAASAAPLAPPAPITAASPVKPSTLPRVLNVEPEKAGLGQRILVQVDNLPALLAAAGDRCPNIVLFLDAVPIPGLEPLRCNTADGTVAYTLQIDEENPVDDAAWHNLLGSPDGLTRAVRLSLGPSKDVSIETDVRDDHAFLLVLLYDFYFYLWLGVTVVLIGCTVFLARHSNLLRDTYAAVPDGVQRPYSLSRFQAVFWCVLVLICFFLIWTISGELGSISGSVLGLLGIGSGTALGAALIDSDKSPKSAAPAAAATPPAGAPPPGAARPVTDAGSQGFLRDLLSGTDGISFHRFQLFVWTIVLGLIFCSTVYDTLSMPQFDASLLALLGISAGTYLGFKIPEKDEPGPDGAPKTG